MATDFWQKYKDPRWQKRRLEIMGLASWSCDNCGDKEATLNVHHKLYRKGADPWDYPDEHLECLCESCHEAKHATKTLLNQILASSNVDQNDLTGLISGWLDANVDADPGYSESGRQCSPVFYEIGLAAAAIEFAVFTNATSQPARDIVRQVFNGKRCSPTIRRSIEAWDEEGASHKDTGMESAR